MITAAAIIFLIIAAFAIPLSMPNGVEKFSGVKREAAIEALEFNRALRKQWLNAVVENVYHNPDSAGPCTSPRDDPNRVGYYNITIRNVTLFGFTYSVVDYRGCVI